MRTAVVYYSLNGNTRMIAEKLAEALSADLVPLYPEKAYPDKGFRKFLRGGRSAIRMETPALKPYAFEAEQYGQVILGFPNWASNVAPPVRTFLRDHKDSLQGKRVAAFVCQGGSGGEKALARLQECLGQETLAATVILNDPKDRPNPGNEQKLDAFRSSLA